MVVSKDAVVSLLELVERLIDIEPAILEANNPEAMMALSNFISCSKELQRYLNE